MQSHRLSPRGVTPVEPTTAPKWLRGWWIPDAALLVLRLAAALLMIQLGAQTLFGVLLPHGEAFAGPPAAFTDAWIIAVLELAGGAMLLLGLLTRPASLVLTAVMVFSFFTERAPSDYWPLADAGSLTVLAFFLFIAFAAIGPGVFSADALMGNRRTRSQAATVPMSPWIKRQYRRHSLTR